MRAFFDAGDDAYARGPAGVDPLGLCQGFLGEHQPERVELRFDALDAAEVLGDQVPRGHLAGPHGLGLPGHPGETQLRQLHEPTLSAHR